MPFPIFKKNDKTNDPVLLFKTIFKHLNCLVSSVFTDGKDGHGQVLMLCRQKLPNNYHGWCSAPLLNLFDTFFITLQKHFLYV